MSTPAKAVPARRILGPAAFSGDPRRFFHLTLTLALTDFKLRFYGSALGYLWSLARPLLLFGVLYAVFSQIVRLGEGVAFYPVVLLSGIVLYTYFAETTSTAVASMLDRENLVRKIDFPRMVIPLSVALTAALNLALNLVVVFVFMLAAGVEPRWSWLELPLIVAALVFLATGIGMLVAALYVPFRDVRPIWDVVLQALFYATPVLYPIEQLARLGEGFARLALMNPLAVIVQQFRHAMIDPSAPSAAEAIGGAPWLLLPAAFAVALFLLGLGVFNRMAPHAAEQL